MEEIKAGNLIIGNKLLFKDQIIEVVGISGATRSFGHQNITICFSNRERCKMHSIKSPHPIPLTEDRLIEGWG